MLAQVGEGNTAVGRPHIADALVAAGVVADRSEAFAKLLYTGSPYYVPQDALDPLEAVRLVREAGGVPVIAHPMYDAWTRVEPGVPGFDGGCWPGGRGGVSPVRTPRRPGASAGVH